MIEAYVFECSYTSNQHYKFIKDKNFFKDD